jgi:hypothetical protein
MTFRMRYESGTCRRSRRNEGRIGEPTAEADRGRHPGFPSFKVLAGGPGSLAERSSPEASAMGVAIRRVPPDWVHPKDADGNFLPMYDDDYESASHRWLEDLMAWERGDHPERKKADEAGYRFYWDWMCPPPDSRLYRPRFDAEPTCYQLYENTSEGTPISEVFATLEEFTQYLLDRGHSQKAVRVFLEKGFAASMFIGKDGTYLEGIDTWDADLAKPSATGDRPGD